VIDNCGGTTTAAVGTSGKVQGFLIAMTNWQTAVERTVSGLGYDLVDAEKSAGGLLRVFIDHVPPVDAFITVDDCEKVTRQLQHVLEVEGCAYERLEVSSPGLDRPLKKAADYARFAGEQVEVTLKLPFKGRKKYRGALQALGADGWRLVLVDARADRTDRTVAKASKRVAPAGSARETAAPAHDQALDFSLDEVREAHLVPVVDFKGRRFAAPEAATGHALGADDEIDGGRIQ
jgi:ribosome maturation factor RimP